MDDAVSILAHLNANQLIFGALLAVAGLFFGDLYRTIKSNKTASIELGTKLKEIETKIESVDKMLAVKSDRINQLDGSFKDLNKSVHNMTLMFGRYDAQVEKMVWNEVQARKENCPDSLKKFVDENY